MALLSLLEMKFFLCASFPMEQEWGCFIALGLGNHFCRLLLPSPAPLGTGLALTSGPICCLPSTSYQLSAFLWALLGLGILVFISQLFIFSFYQFFFLGGVPFFLLRKHLPPPPPYSSNITIVVTECDCWFTDVFNVSKKGKKRKVYWSVASFSFLLCLTDTRNLEERAPSSFIDSETHPPLHVGASLFPLICSWILR